MYSWLTSSLVRFGHFAEHETVYHANRRKSLSGVFLSLLNAGNSYLLQSKYLCKRAEQKTLHDTHTALLVVQ
ncbi:hypothetical protein M3J09_007039 [Ascochyta lentis]